MKRLVLAWAATAVAATGAAVAVLGLLGGGLTGSSGRVMTQEEAGAALARVTATAQAPSPGPSQSPAESPTASSPTQEPPENEVIRTPGGTVIASCAGGRVTLRSWSPAQGYSVDGVEPGPAAKAEVEFEADAEEAEDVEVKVGCAGGRPVTLQD